MSVEQRWMRVTLKEYALCIAYCYYLLYLVFYMDVVKNMITANSIYHCFLNVQKKHEAYIIQ